MVSKTRDDIDPRVKSPDVSTEKLNGWSDDYALINTNNFDFIVQYVEHDLLPEWANGIQIEYRTSFKSIPDENIRTAVSEVVGFALGTHLNKIGETHLDHSQKVIKRIAISPWGDNVVEKCKAHAQPPISYDYPADRKKIEFVLNKITQKYIELRSVMGLNDILWKYWIAQELAVGVNLPIFSSALETLAENFISSKGVIQKYSEEDKNKHKMLVEKYVPELFFSELQKTSYGNRLSNAIRNPFNLGVGEKLSLFFNALGFQITNDTVENQAIKARNKMTHGSIDNTDVPERNKYTKLTEAYATLMNRCILSVLDYNEQYIDYYTPGLPERNLKQNINSL